MLRSGIDQMRYAAGILRGRLRPDVLTRVSQDLVATLREFGTVGDDSQLLPGRQGVIDPDVQNTITTRALRRTAGRAAAQTAYYGRLFGELGIRPEELTADTWSQVPPTSKASLRAMPAAFVASGSVPYLMAATTGTTGTPTVVWYSQGDLENVIALSTIAMAMTLGVRPHDVVATGVSSRATLGYLVTAEIVRRVGAAFVQIGSIAPELVLERLATPLNLPGRAPRITNFSAPASVFASLVETAERDGWRPADFGLTDLLSGGEVVSEALRARVEEAFGVAPERAYQATEILPAGGAHCSQGHLHYPAEFGHIELLDPRTLEPAAPGGAATLVVTPYVPYRECTMLLRYVTNDLVRVPDTTPTCELAGMAASSDILGRYDGPLSVAVPTRSILDLLEAERAIPLPARYCLVDEPGGPVLHVVARQRSARILGRLEERAAALGVAVKGIVVHDDAELLPARNTVRADLREYSFDSAGQVGGGDEYQRAVRPGDGGDPSRGVRSDEALAGSRP
ncbi:phenylacetate-CoA ligase [Catenulispora sp. EB89]|uniref:phenylacetate--CoA ligase family protein n=1 Tax=Catenulispora sp. EB89 TaxID=3156257 RepID=UPI0035132ACC